MIVDFFMNLHIDLNVAIEKRKNFDATNRETISAQNIDFFDVAIDENSEKKIINDSIIEFDDIFTERSRTTTDVNIEKNKNFDEMKNDEMIDSNEKIIDSKANETTNC